MDQVLNTELRKDKIGCGCAARDIRSIYYIYIPSVASKTNQHMPKPNIRGYSIAEYLLYGTVLQSTLLDAECGSDASTIH